MEEQDWDFGRIESQSSRVPPFEPKNAGGKRTRQASDIPHSLHSCSPCPYWRLFLFLCVPGSCSHSLRPTLSLPRALSVCAQRDPNPLHVTARRSCAIVLDVGASGGWRADRLPGCLASQHSVLLLVSVPVSCVALQLESSPSPSLSP